MARKVGVLYEEVVSGGVMRVIEHRTRIFCVSVYDGVILVSRDGDLLDQYEKDQLVLDLGRDWVQDRDWASYHDDAMERRGND